MTRKLTFDDMDELVHNLSGPDNLDSLRQMADIATEALVIRIKDEGPSLCKDNVVDLLADHRAKDLFGWWIAVANLRANVRTSSRA